MGWVATLAEEDLLLPDPKPLDTGVPELDITEGLSLRMTQAMSHYQHEELHCFVCGTIGLPGMPQQYGTTCLPSMISSHWKGVSLVVSMLIVKEEICHAWAVNLDVLKIPQCGISLQDM